MIAYGLSTGLVDSTVCGCYAMKQLMNSSRCIFYSYFLLLFDLSKLHVQQEFAQEVIKYYNLYRSIELFETEDILASVLQFEISL